MRNAASFGLIPVLCLSLFGCVAQQPLVKQTASGYPEGTFRNTTPDIVRSKIIAGCASLGAMVLESSADYVVCGRETKGSETFAASLAIGSSYSTTPQRKVRFTIFKVGEDVRVTAQEWIECQSAYGQTRVMELKANNQRNYIQNFLFSLGAE